MAAVPRLLQYYEGATTPDPASLGLIVWPSGTVCACSFVTSPRRSRRPAGRTAGQDWFEAGHPRRLFVSHGRNRVSQVPWQAIPWLCDRSRDPGRSVAPRLGGASGAAPTNGTMKAPALDVSRLNVRRFATPCVRFATRVAARHATLGPGWRTAPLPGGS